MIARHSSRSSCAAILVEFTRSQNNTVRWRHSPARASRDSAARIGAAASSGAPHLPQKFDAGGFSAPHFTQSLIRAFPHCTQKLLPVGLFVPHLEQRISSPDAHASRTSFITQRRVETT